MRRAQFLADMDKIIPWPDLAAAVGRRSCEFSGPPLLLYYLPFGNLSPGPNSSTEIP